MGCTRDLNSWFGCLAAPDQLPTWPQLRQLGVGFWLRDQQFLASTMEKLAKQQFAERRNADDCALLYCALGKRSVLQVRCQLNSILLCCWLQCLSQQKRLAILLLFVLFEGVVLLPLPSRPTLTHFVT